MASLLSLVVNGATRLNNDTIGKNIYADKHITNGGSNIQFVKGDGTLDNNSYAKSSDLNAYLPLAGGTMKTNATVYFQNTSNIVQYTNTTSNYVRTISWYLGSSAPSSGAPAHIGWHNTGDSSGAIVLMPYSSTANAWGASVGLYVSATRHLYNGYTVLDSSNSSVSGGGSSWGSSITVKINGSSKTLTIPGNPNTDYRVTQTVTSASNTSWRPFIVGMSYSDADPFAPTTTTDSVYATHKLKMQPSTGNIQMSGNLILRGTSSNVMTYTGNVHPYIAFENSDGSQNIRLLFTDYDTYRGPAGIKLIGNQGKEWFEVDGSIYAAGFYKANGTSVSYEGHTHSYASIGTVAFTPANGELTAADVLAKTGNWSIKKGTWDYSGNGYIKAGDFGNIDLAGTSILTFGTSSAYTQLYITAPTQSGHSGKTNEIFFYNDHSNGDGVSYSPGWTRVITNRNYTDYVNTTNFPGLNKVGTVTQVIAGTGISVSATTANQSTYTVTNAGVRATTINGDYLRVNTNGTNADLTIPYATRASIAGDGTMNIIPQYTNEVNFGGTSNSTTLYFGYRATDSKPIPTQFIFGGSAGSASIKASGFAKKDSSDSYVLLGGGGHKALSYFAAAADIPNVTDYYWANVKVSGSSNELTTPTFGKVTIYDGTNSILSLKTKTPGAYAYLAAYNTGGQYGADIVLHSGSAMVLGAGESAANMHTNNVDSLQGSENLYLTADGVVKIFTNCNTIANRKNAATFDTAGNTTLGGSLSFNDTSIYRISPMIKFGSYNQDTILWKVYSSDSTYADKGVFGFDMTYKGTGSADGNHLILHADNQNAAAKVEAMTVTQAGVVSFAKTVGASISGNAASADKLNTVSKTAWGQTYWTSGGVPTTISGDMTSVGNVTPSANNSKNLGTSSAKWKNVYATDFHGNLTGDVTGDLTGDVTGNVTGDLYGNADTATNADKLDGLHSYAFIKTWDASAGKSYTGWITIAKWTITTAAQFSPYPFMLSIYRNYNSPAPESYTFSLTFGWDTATITQISGNAKNRIIEKIRVAKSSDSLTYKLEMYVNTDYTTYENKCCCIAYGYYGNSFSGTTCCEKTSSMTTTLEEIVTKSDSMVGDIFGLAENAKNIRVTTTNPTAGTWYYPIWTSGMTANTDYAPRANDGLRHYSLNGTTSAAGSTILQLGNSTATGASGNKTGRLRIYGSSSYYSDIYGSETASCSFYFPNTGGTVVTHATRGTGVGSGTKHVYIASTGRATQSSSNVGGTDRPMYLSAGTMTQTTFRMAGTNTTATTAVSINADISTGIWYVNDTSVSGLYAQTDGVAIVNHYNASWITQIYQDYRTGQLAVRGKNNGTWQAWRKILDSSNYGTILGNTYWKVNAQTTAGTGDIYLEMWRGTNASWKIINTSGILKFQSNYTTAVGSYYDALTIAYNTGNTTIKGLTTTAGLTSSAAITLSGTTSDNATIAFSRAGYNYITGPASSTISLHPGGLTKGSSTGYAFTSTEFGVGVTGTYNIGTSTKRFKNVYAQHFYVGGTASNTTAKLTSDSTDNIYLSVADKAMLVVNSTSNVVRSGLSLAGTIDLGASDCKWNAIYANSVYSTFYGNVYGNLYGNAASASKLNTNAGGVAKPVYFSGGVPVACSSTVGGVAKPVYMSSGTITACSSTVGASGRPVYMNAGTITAISVNTVTSSTLYVVGVTAADSSLYTGTKSSNGVRILSGNTLYAYGGFYETSDERLKVFGNEVEVDLDKILQLPKVYFTWKNDESKKSNIGTSAQELQKIYPELVSTDDDGILHVAYDKLSIIALRGIDKLYKEITDLKKRVETLESK